MNTLIDVVSEKYNVDKIYLSFIENNINGMALYESLGFKYTGDKDPKGELIYALDFRNS